MGIQKLTATNGFYEIELKFWEEFKLFIKLIPNKEHFVWRGQAVANWPINSSLQRKIKELRRKGIKVDETNLKKHLENFKKACTGIKEEHQYFKEDEWWALGQHFGLCTPLLDWTISPFVAAYFAFMDEKNCKKRAIFGIFKSKINDKSETLKKVKLKPAILEFVEPKLEEIPRLNSQRGLFTKSAVFSKDWDIIDWIKENFKNDKEISLVKIIIPNTERIKCLRFLESMKINHFYLFPDLFGASLYCNYKLSLKKTITENLINGLLT